METVDSHEISRQDPLAVYRPFLDELNRVLEKRGEAATLQEFARHPQNARILQHAYRLAFQHERDISELSPKELVGHAHLGTLISVNIKLFLPSEKQSSEYLDLGKEIPPAYIDWLLKRPHPFSSFLSDLFTIEIGRVCWVEIERRSLEHPELTAVEDYKLATPKREALKYLQERILSERIQLAKKYGLELLSQLEIAIGKGIGNFVKLVTEEFGLQKGHFVFSKLSYTAESQFPKFEKKISAELVMKSLAPPELEKCIVLQCDYLVRCIAIDQLGLSINGGYSSQKHEADKAFTKLSDVMNIRREGRRYTNILDRGFPIIKAEREEGEGLLVSSVAENEALQGLYAGAEYWAGKEIEDIIITGLEGKLIPSLKQVVEHDLIDATRKEKRHQERQVLEMDYRGESLKLIQPNGSSTKISGIDKEGETPSLFDQIPTPQNYEEEVIEPIGLKKLGFNIAELTPRELLLLDELRDAARKGYTKDSKEGLSLRQYWTDERVYQSKMKMLQRLEAKRKKP